MRFTYFLSTLLVMGMYATTCGSAHAQPDTNTPAKGDNPPNWNWNPGGRGGNRGQMGQMGRMRITPEQIAQFKAQQVEMRTINIKQQLTQAGFTDDALQTAVVNEYKEQNAAQNDLLAKWQKINQALQQNNTPQADMTAMLKDFRDASDKEKSRRKAATEALEAQFKVSQNPALDATLMTLGITGDEAGLVGQTSGGAVGQMLNIFGGMGPGGLANILGGMGGNMQGLMRGGGAGNANNAPANGAPVFF